MANLQHSSPVAYITGEITKGAPLALLVCAVLTFAAVGIFVFDYYQSLFLPRFGSSGAAAMAGLIAGVQELVRFSLLVASIRDFSENRRGNGWLGLLGSVALVGHDLHTAGEVARLWNIETSNQYANILTYLVLVGLLLEIRLILTSSGNRGSLPPSATLERGNGIARSEPRANGVYAAGDH
jgi:hypothetical protein